jgi:hypothetical protein
LTPYWTITPSKTQDPQYSSTEGPPKSTIFPTPTPTPIYYEIAEGDTFTSIAFRHGVKLNELIAANPDIDPNFLTIGITITIPSINENTISIPTPTPIPISFSEPVCYPTSDQGLWCIFMVENNQSFVIENVSGVIHLKSPNFQEISVETNSPVNIIQPGDRMPLTAFFQPTIPEDFTSKAEILSLLPVQESDERYLQTDIKILDINISKNELSAAISGEILFQDENKTVDQVWITAVAYDIDGNPIGMRSWNSKDELLPNQSLSFALTVFSLGPPIDQIEILGEAQGK